MLVIARKLNETIVFPELDIEVRVLKTQGGQVRLGIDAPVEVSIRRGELEGSAVPSRPTYQLQKSDPLQIVAERSQSFSVSS